MGVRVGHAVLEVLWERPTTSPTSPSAGNVAVSHAVLEALMLPSSSVRVAQAILEVVEKIGDAADTPGGGGSGTATTHAFGYAV